MRTSIFALSLLLSLGAKAAAGFLDFRTEEFDLSSVKEKKWRVGLGVDYLSYPTNLPVYQGVHEEIEQEENYNVYGLNLGLGRDFSLGAGFSATLKTGAFYATSLTENRGKAGEDLDEKLATIRDSHKVYGAEAGLSLNYLVENKVLNFQPFIEFFTGQGRSGIEKEYLFQGIQPDQSDAEDYYAEVSEEFSYTKTSIGVNFISWQGVLSYFKITQMVLDVKERETTGAVNSTEIDSKESSPESKDLLSASIGFAYLF